MQTATKRMMVLAVAAVLAMPVSAWAQKGWVAGLAFGPSSHDLDELDELLVCREFTELESTEFGTAFTARKLINGKVISVERPRCSVDRTSTRPGPTFVSSWAVVASESESRPRLPHGTAAIAGFAAKSYSCKSIILTDLRRQE